MTSSVAKQTYKQGLYTVRNPEKYVGDVNKVFFRSSWELEANKFFDNNTKILRWASEELKIPYYKPTTKRVHNYYPDYWIEFEDRSGKIVQEVIEVKPRDQVDIHMKKRLTDYDRLMYHINVAKWEAATKYCNDRGMKFRIITEMHVFRN